VHWVFVSLLKIAALRSSILGASNKSFPNKEPSSS
jgi:hypothetical protein